MINNIFDKRRFVIWSCIIENIRQFLRSPIPLPVGKPIIPTHLKSNQCLIILFEKRREAGEKRRNATGKQRGHGEQREATASDGKRREATASDGNPARTDRSALPVGERLSGKYLSVNTAISERLIKSIPLMIRHFDFDHQGSNLQDYVDCELGNNRLDWTTPKSNFFLFIPYVITSGMAATETPPEMPKAVHWPRQALWLPHCSRRASTGRRASTRRRAATLNPTRSY